MHKRPLMVFLTLLILGATPLAAAGGGNLTSIEEQEVLEAQNRYRAEVGVLPLVWSDALAAQAQRCADENAARLEAQGPFMHCFTLGYGQNMARSAPGLNLTGQVDLWGSEKKLFNNGAYPSVSATGTPATVSHYTQMIWQDTKEVGCGCAKAKGFEILVCDYSPGGNIEGMWVHSPPQPAVIPVQRTSAYVGWSQRDVITNTAMNRPISCYTISPV